MVELGRGRRRDARADRRRARPPLRGAPRPTCGAPTPSSSSSPTSPRTTCRSRCARSRRFCQLLQRRYGGQLDERADQYIDFAVDGAKRMQDLINDLLAFSRVGRMEQPHERRRLPTRWSSASRADLGAGDRGERRRDRGRRRRCRRCAGDAVAAARRVPEPDRQRDQVPRRGRRRAWSSRPSRDGDVLDASAVADNGIGIDAEYAERIFVIFQRLHPRTQYAGTGIGLAMCRKIVEYHGGRIWLDTDADGRSGRHLLLHPACRTRTGASMTDDDSQPISVLLVEDDPGDVVLIEEAFEHNKVRNSAARRRRRRRGAGLPAQRPDANAPRRTSSCSTSTCRARTAARCSPRSRPTRRCADPGRRADDVRRPRRTSCAPTTCTPTPTSPSRSTSTASSRSCARSTSSSSPSSSCRRTARRRDEALVGARSRLSCSPGVGPTTAPREPARDGADHAARHRDAERDARAGAHGDPDAAHPPPAGGWSRPG